MTTTAQVEANRRNALKSTGPKTVEGKIIAAGNATKHGLLAELPVVPELESQEDWERHLENINDNLRPNGYFETLLVERIAINLWKLGRAARWETARIASAVVGANERDPLSDLLRSRPIAGPRAETDTIEAAIRVVRLIQDGDANTSVAPEVADLLLETIAGRLRISLTEPGCPTFPGVPDNVALAGFDGWTTGIVSDAVNMLAQWSDTPALTLLVEAEAGLADAVRRRRAQEHAARVQRLILDRSQLDKLARYEAHLERSTFKSLHELQRLQAAREGRSVPAPAVLDVSMDRA